MPKEHQGSCHCGKVQYKAKVNLEKVMTCNCSICNRTGTILTFISENAFKLESGENALTDYQFNKKNVHHLFCKTCGVKSFSWGMDNKGNKMYAVNVRCLNGVDITKLNPEHVNGKDF